MDIEFSDIEKYLDGNMTSAEKKQFEHMLSGDPILQKEVEAHRSLRHDLAYHFAAQDVAAANALRNGPMPNRTRWWRYVRMIGGLLMALWAIWALFLKKWEGVGNPALPGSENAVPPVPPEPKGNPETLPSPSVPSTITPTNQKPQAFRQPNQPIADNQAGKNPSISTAPPPLVRGMQDADSIWQAEIRSLWFVEYPPAGMLVSGPFAKADQLLREKDFANAYAQLQRLERNLPENDTLKLLKGYCLLEMQEGELALGHWMGLEERHTSWQPLLEWYRALAMMTAGRRDEAKEKMHQIVGKKSHPYAKQADKALKVLND